MSAAVFKQVFDVIRLKGTEDLEEEGSLGLLGGRPIVGHVRKPPRQLHGMEPNLFDSQFRPERDPEMPDLVPLEVQLVFCEDLLEEVQGASLLSRKVDLLNGATSRL